MSRDWAYKLREADPGFAERCAEMLAVAKARIPVRVNRDRGEGWTATSEARFLAALAVTGDVPVAASSAGKAASTAYRRRQARPGFASRWRKALASDDGRWAPDWLESAKCFFEGRAPPGENPVRLTSIGDVLRLLGRTARTERRDRAPRPS